MPVVQHQYDLPDEDELAKLVGAATPHFAFQIRARVQAYRNALPPDHARIPELDAHIATLERLGTHGEHGGVDDLDLPPSGSLVQE
ncbi:MAG: hypothetical protein ACR2N6_02350 [Miltoncostaeaceae bacterium]